MPRRPGDVGLYCRTGTLDPLVQLDPVARRQRDDRLLPAARGAGDPASTGRVPPLAVNIDDVHSLHLHLEDLLDRPFHVELVGLPGHLEDVFPFRIEHRVLLGDNGPQQHLVAVHDAVTSGLAPAASGELAAACPFAGAAGAKAATGRRRISAVRVRVSASTASVVMSSQRYLRTSSKFVPPGSTVRTFGRFAAARLTPSSR